MLVLDACVGSEKIYQNWHKKLGDDFIGIDRRKGDFTVKKAPNRQQMVDVPIIIKPTILADMKFLPLKDHVADCIVIDPPHLDCGLTGFLGKAYGSWDQTETIRTCRSINEEFQRVLKREGQLILKVLPRAFPIYETLLKNFLFYLPIQTKRARGCIKYKVDQDAAIWAIGFSIQCK